MNQHTSVVIVGSLNLDLVVQVAQLPQRGETLPGSGFLTLPGGKGANQACAVGRLGQTNTAAMIGCVGLDAYGQLLLESLRAAGVDVRYVRGTMEAATGIALIVVEASGQNQIVVVPGANDCLRPAEVTEALTALGGSHLLLQLETPIDTVTAAAQHARALGMTVILDPAPARPLSVALLRHVNILTPNESEALALLGASGNHIPLAEVADIARQLLALGPQQVILKLGEQGAFLADGERACHFPARSVTAKDTTAAGDCFNGALATGLAERMPLVEAIPFANVAASVSITRFGAQASLPHRLEVDQTLGNLLH
ncbi:MAG TPA: ribokinase [Blastocatellia bacterium]|jgi:ribokinase|nr:ribokinase [Blastocatellia bacterium]